MGVPYGCPLDMWSVGVVLAEIFTGKLLFPGASNNAMLKLFLEFMGAMPKKLDQARRVRQRLL
jgi:serine/threonine-protein kinase PRP4